MRYLGLFLSALALFFTLLPVPAVLEMENPRRTVMMLFSLSPVLVLFLSFLFSAAGRMQGLALNPPVEGLAGRLQHWGFPILHRHSWGDFGRLYALLFLVFMGPVLLALFVTLISIPFIGFEQRLDIRDEADLQILQRPEALSAAEREEILQRPTETEAIRGVARGDIALGAADQDRVDLVLRLAQIAAALGYILTFPCFTRLVPFYFWRSGGPAAATLAATWRRVPWKIASPFGLILLAGLATLFFLPIPLWLRYVLTAGFFACWAYALAHQVGPYAPKEVKVLQ